MKTICCICKKEYKYIIDETKSTNENILNNVIERNKFQLFTSFGNYGSKFDMKQTSLVICENCIINLSEPSLQDIL